MSSDSDKLLEDDVLKEIIEELCDDIYYMKEGKIITR